MSDVLVVKEHTHLAWPEIETKRRKMNINTVNVKDCSQPSVFFVFFFDR